MLTTTQLDDIKYLRRLCEQADGLFLKLNEDLLRSDTRGDNFDYFRYDADGALIGFLALYGFGDQFEVCGMVRPDCRRQGLFTQLWNEALASGALDTAESILLNAPKASDSAAAWLRTLHCRYSFSEYEMKWQDDVPGSLDEAPGTPVSYRPFQPEDFPTVVRLYADGFEMKESEVSSMIDEERPNASRTRSMIVRRGETVGTLVLDYDIPGESSIFGLVVDDAYRGQGIGRSILRQIIRSERERGQQILIGVETENEHALRLYESCGFRAYTVQDYYELKR